MPHVIVTYADKFGYRCSKLALHDGAGGVGRSHIPSMLHPYRRCSRPGESGHENLHRNPEKIRNPNGGIFLPPAMFVYRSGMVKSSPSLKKRVCFFAIWVKTNGEVQVQPGS